MNTNHAIIAALAAASIASADAPRISGWTTVSFNKDLNNPVTRDYSTPLGSLNYYGGREASFQLNAVHATLAGGDSAGASYVVDIDAGTDASHNAGTLVASSGWGLDLQQAYVSLPIGTTPLGFQAGKFYTSEGTEVLNSASNPTASRGLIFSQLEPLAHTGILANVKINDHLGVSVGGVNGFDAWTTSSASGIPLGYAKASVSFGDPLAATASAYYGTNATWGYDTAGAQVPSRNALLSLDLTGVTKFVPGLDLNFQANLLRLHADSSKGISTGWTKYGLGLQPLYRVGSAQIGVRYEFLSVDDGDADIKVHSISVAPGYRPTPSSLVRIEYRIDAASEKIFTSDEAASDLENDQILTAEVNYTF